VVLGLLLPIAGVMVLRGMENMKDAPKRSAPELERVARALLKYQEDNGTLPPAVVYDDEGRPLYSWRVLILPYLGHRSLYRHFRLDQPWDSEDNLALLERMPAVYAPPRTKRSHIPRHHTVVHVFVGPLAAFDGKEGLAVPADFPNGAANTLLVVEAGDPVPWTSPEGIPYNPYGPLPRLNGLFAGGFRAAMADGSVRFIPRRMDENKLRELIQRDNWSQLLGSNW
jgi:hypothetical protein